MKRAEPGCTVYRDMTSPSGYSVLFLYENAEAENVRLAGTFGFVAKVEGKADEEYRICRPFEWVCGRKLHAIEELTFDMERNECGQWYFRMPLPSGAYEYHYIVDGVEIADPAANESMYTTHVDCKDPSRINHTYEKRSFAYVPFDAQRQDVDFSYLMPLAPENRGTKEFAVYGTPSDVSDFRITGEAVAFVHPENRLSVYLPEGYNADREEPYKVLYFAHGGGESEVALFRYFHDRVIGHAIEDGETEPFLLVGWNCFASPTEKPWPSWHDNRVLANLEQNIIPYVEKHYHVRNSPEGRAIMGWSAGGAVTHTALLYYSDLFGYFGMYGMGESAELPEDYAVFRGRIAKDRRIVIGCGSYDRKPAGVGAVKTIRYDHTKAAYDGLTEGAGLENIIWLDGPTAHDNQTWYYMENYFIRKVLWK